MRKFNYSNLKNRTWDIKIINYLTQIHEEKGKQQKLPEAGAEFDSSQLNTDVFNTVIAFRMLEIMRNNGLIDESEYAKVEKKRARYKGNVIDKRKTKKAVIQYD